MTAHVEWFPVLPFGRTAPRATPVAERQPSGTPLDLERLHPRDRADLGLPEPALDPARVLERLRLR